MPKQPSRQPKRKTATKPDQGGRPPSGPLKRKTLTARVRPDVLLKLQQDAHRAKLSLGKHIDAIVDGKDGK
tara:strand:- start:1310 stop:1522 length:213 start_codon:yes stop_codon:yes gene_type:complete